MADMVWRGIGAATAIAALWGAGIRLGYRFGVADERMREDVWRYFNDGDLPPGYEERLRR